MEPAVELGASVNGQEHKGGEMGDDSQLDLEEGQLRAVGTKPSPQAAARRLIEQEMAVLGDVADAVRERAVNLPPGSEIRAHLLRAANAYALAAEQEPARGLRLAT